MNPLKVCEGALCILPLPTLTIVTGTSALHWGGSYGFPADSRLLVTSGSNGLYERQGVKSCVSSLLSFPAAYSSKELVNSDNSVTVLYKQTGKNMVNPDMPGGSLPVGLFHNQLPPRKADDVSRSTEQDFLRSP